MSDSSQDISFALYRYTPSVPAAVVVAAAFVVLIVLHGHHLFRHRALYFIPFLIGLVCKFKDSSLKIPSFTNRSFTANSRSGRLYCESLFTFQYSRSWPLYCSNHAYTRRTPIICSIHIYDFGKTNCFAACGIIYDHSRQVLD